MDDVKSTDSHLVMAPCVEWASDGYASRIGARRCMEGLRFWSRFDPTDELLELRWLKTIIPVLADGWQNTQCEDADQSGPSSFHRAKTVQGRSQEQHLWGC